LQTQNQPAPRRFRGVVDARRHPRFKIKVSITVRSRTCGVLIGYTVDISESGIAAILKNEVPLGEIVELEFNLPFGAVSICATARQKSAFRYGFQFVESNGTNQAIRNSCRQFAIEQSLRAKP
jgi:PilZ domain